MIINVYQGEVKEWLPLKHNLKGAYSMQSKKELLKRATELGIVGRWDMTKEQLQKEINEVEVILKTIDEIKQPKKDEEVIPTCESNVDNEKEWDDDLEKTQPVLNKIEKTIVVNGEERKISMVDKDIKYKFIEEAPIGTMIAFDIGRGRARSAKIANRSKQRKLLKLVNKQGDEFIIPYEHVLWVRKNGMWPKAIYEMLTGGKHHGTENFKTK